MKIIIIIKKGYSKELITYICQELKEMRIKWNLKF